MQKITKPIILTVVAVIVALVIVGQVAAPAAGTNEELAGSNFTLRSSATSTERICQNIAGLWQSAEDPAFTRTFNVDGTVTDHYRGDPSATSVGTWSIFTSANPDPALDTVVPGVIYLEIESNEDKIFFSIVRINDNELQLKYLDRQGYSMNFTRVR